MNARKGGPDGDHDDTRAKSAVSTDIYYLDNEGYRVEDEGAASKVLTIELDEDQNIIRATLQKKAGTKM